MLPDRPKSSKWKTVRGPMVAVALVATALGLVVNERWRWGYPRHLSFDRSSAPGWLSTVIHRDFRMYDGSDVDALMSYVASERLLIGKSRGEIAELLGPPDATGNLLPMPLGADKDDFLYVVGRVPLERHAGPPTVLCHFGADGKCDKLILSASQ